MNQLELEIESLKRQLAEAKAEITFLKTEMVELDERRQQGNAYRPRQATCSMCGGLNSEPRMPYCYSCMVTENREKELDELYDEEQDVEEVEDEDEEEVEEEGDDEEEKEEKEDRRQTHTVKEPWKSMMTEMEEEEDADYMGQAEYQRKYCDENGQEYDDECWYESPIKTITVDQMMLALDKLPRKAQLVITEDGYYSDTEFAKMMLPEPYTIKNKIPRLPDGTQVYRIGHSYQHYGKQYWEKYWEKY